MVQRSTPLKFSKVVSPGGTVCGECGRFNAEDEGEHRIYYNGAHHFWCSYCDKETIVDPETDPL